MKFNAGNLMLFLMRTVKFSAAASRAGLHHGKIELLYKHTRYSQQKQMKIYCTSSLRRLKSPKTKVNIHTLEK